MLIFLLLGCGQSLPYVIIILSIIAVVTIVVLAQYFISDIILKNVVCVVAVIWSLIFMFFALKLEVDAGY